MFTDRITLQDATPADQHYDAVVLGSTKTIRRDASRDLDQPMALTISHEVSKDSKHVNSAVMLDRTELDSGDSVTLGNARVLLKISYDTEQITGAMIQEMVDEIKEFASTANVTKLLNREH
jgi:hypothetical protein